MTEDFRDNDSFTLGGEEGEGARVGLIKVAPLF